MNYNLTAAKTKCLLNFISLLLVFIIPVPAVTGQTVSINEVMASNGETIADMDGDFEDWVEFYNYGDEPVDLEGYGFSDDYDNPFRWIFPSVTIDPGEYLLVWASGKDRRPEGTWINGTRHEVLLGNKTELHTNFRIAREGEELLLTSTDAVRVDEIPPTEIPRDMSYGRYPDGTGEWLWYTDPTPGQPNHDGGLSEMPVIPDPPRFTRNGGPFTEDFLLGFEFDEGLEIYFTTDGSEPKPGISSLYSQPFDISETAIVRAVSYKPGVATSKIVKELYTKLTNSTNQFSSNLPLMVIHKFDQTISAGHPRVPVYITINDKGEDGRVRLSDDPVLQSRAVINMRGSSSMRFPKKMFGFHLQEEDGSNRKEALLGMPEEHNWILNGPYSDKSLMRNVIAYGLSNDIGRYSPRTRFIEVYLHDGTGPLTDDHYHGVYVLIERIKWADGRVEIEKIGQDDNQAPEITGGYIIKNDRFNPGEEGLMTERGTNLAFVRPMEGDITPQQKAWLENYLTAFETALFGDNFKDFNKGYNNYIDADSFIDAHLITELLKEIDGYRLSTFMHKERNDKLVMGPLWDFNLSLGNANYREGWKPEGWYYELISEAQYLNGWYSRLFEDPEFMARYQERWWQLRRGQFSDDSLRNRINHYANLLDESQERNFERWPVLNQYVWPNWYIAPTYEAEIEWMTDWLMERTNWMDQQLGRPSTLIHYWHFNNLTSGNLTSIPADYSVGNNASVTYSGTGSGYMDRVNDGTLLNASIGQPAGEALRVRNPSSNRELIFSLPTSGYDDIVFRYVVKRTTNGARQQTVYYRTSDHSDWVIFSDTLNITETYRQFRFNFAGIEEAADNPHFSIRILFHGEEASGTSGNNRFDNISLEGYINHFYSKSDGDLTDLTTWGTETDGSGNQPASFNHAYFHVHNRESAVISSNWEVSGKGSRVIVGDGVSPLSLRSEAVLDAIVDIMNKSTLELANSFLPTLNNLKSGSTVIFTGEATSIPYNSYYNLILDNLDPVFNGNGVIEIMGGLSLKGHVQMPDARGNHEYDLVFTGHSEQLISGNGNVVRGYNIVFDKSAGTVTFSDENGGTTLSSDNQMIYKMMPNAAFIDNGITIYAGNSVNISGNPESYNFTGTFVLADYHKGIINGAGNNNNFNIRDSNNNNTNASAELNNLIIRTKNQDGEFRFRDGSTNQFTLKGDLIIESGVSGRLLFYENEVQVGGKLVIEEGFSGTVENISKLIFNGSDSRQLLSTGQTIHIGNLIIDNPENLTLEGTVIVNNNLHLENGNILVSENSLPKLDTGAEISGYDEQRFIDGPLGIYLNNIDPEKVLFPIGKDGTYKPFILEAGHSNTNRNLYIAEKMSDPPAGIAIPEGLLHIAGDYHINLEIVGDYHISSAYATMLHDTHDTELEEDHLRIVKSEGGAWVNLGGTAGSGVVKSTTPFTTPGIFAVAIKEPDLLQINLYPNPATDILQVEFTQNIRYAAVISLFTLNGSKVMERTLAPGDNTSGSINLAGIEPGLYVVKINYGPYNISRIVVII